MAESTLSLALKDIQSKLGVFAGWGRGSLNGDPPWTDQQQAILDDCTQSGLRRFYWPRPVEGQANSYDWSFLRPTATFALPNGGQTVPLPDDFGGFEGQLTILTSTTTSMPWRIEWRSEAALRGMYGVTPNMSGPPMYAAEQPLKGTTGASGQRFQLFIFPAADQAYTLQGMYYINPDYLTGAAPYAYGGAPHAETILESCLAVLEERLDDTSGVHARAFEERLQASISMDRRNKPLKIGYNRDRSDDVDLRLNPHYWAPAATYNGNPFT